MTIEPDGAWFYQQLELGFNYRMTDIQAALGLSQLAGLICLLNRGTLLQILYFDKLESEVSCYRSSTEIAIHLFIFLF